MFDSYINGHDRFKVCEILSLALSKIFHHHLRGTFYLSSYSDLLVITSCLERHNDLMQHKCMFSVPVAIHCFRTLDWMGLHWFYHEACTSSVLLLRMWKVRRWSDLWGIRSMHIKFRISETEDSKVLWNLLRNLPSYTSAAAVGKGYASMPITSEVLFAVWMLISGYFLITVIWVNFNLRIGVEESQEEPQWGYPISGFKF